MNSQLLKHRIEKLIDLTLFEWMILCMALILLPWIRFSLWSMGYQRTRYFLGQLVWSNKIRDENIEAMQKAKCIARMVSIAGNHGPIKADCLKQSLLTWWILSLYGIQSEVKFGVNQQVTEHYWMHAWVEYSGVNLEDNLELQSQFLPLINPVSSDK